MHELNHQLGAEDHYHEIINENTNRCGGGDICSVCGKYPRPATCVMYSSNTDINRPDILCLGCQRDIRKNLKSTHQC